MFFHPRYFGFEQFDTQLQFVLRIGAEVFPGQQAGGIPTGARTIIVFHPCTIIEMLSLAVNRRSR